MTCSCKSTFIIVEKNVEMEGVHELAENVLCTWRSGEVDRTVPHVSRSLEKGTFIIYLYVYISYIHIVLFSNNRTGDGRFVKC